MVVLAPARGEPSVKRCDPCLVVLSVLVLAGCSCRVTRESGTLGAPGQPRRPSGDEIARRLAASGQRRRPSPALPRRSTTRS